LTSSHFKELLSLFNDYHVKYLVVGGYAVMKYAEPRYTKDIDILVKADRENAVLVFRALRAFGAPLSGMSEDDFAHEGYFYQIGVAPMRIDILMSVKDVSFDDAWRNRLESDLGGVEATFISKQDLIKSKRAAGRPQDLIDVELLSLSDNVKGEAKE
jgi:hypothetical protein